MTWPRYKVGDTQQFKYTIASGSSVSSLMAMLYMGSASALFMVNSWTASESGSGLGLYYVNAQLPSTPGFYLLEWVGFAGSLATPPGGAAPWKARWPFQLTMEEVDN